MCPVSVGIAGDIWVLRVTGERKEVCLMEQPEIPQKEGSLSARISQELKWIQITSLATDQPKITTAVLDTRYLYSKARL